MRRGCCRCWRRRTSRSCTETCRDAEPKHPNPTPVSQRALDVATRLRRRLVFFPDGQAMRRAESRRACMPVDIDPARDAMGESPARRSIARMEKISRDRLGRRHRHAVACGSGGAVHDSAGARDAGLRLHDTQGTRCRCPALLQSRANRDHRTRGARRHVEGRRPRRGRRRRERDSGLDDQRRRHDLAGRRQAARRVLASADAGRWSRHLALHRPTSGAGTFRLQMNRRAATDGEGCVGERQCLPVDPNPPSPRCDASNSSTRRNVACTTGTMTICAMRSIGLIVNAAWPRFQQLTISWPW